ncbi:MAG: Chitin synthase, class 3 [Trizodia sp. TS-e1964]|nr:MAG: Chitin synthase, class 3 [Trizodia sp. TS-e1964]
MSLPQRPLPTSPIRQQPVPAYRNSPSRHSRPQDVETAEYFSQPTPPPRTPYSPTRRGAGSEKQMRAAALPSPNMPASDADPLTSQTTAPVELGRKRSLIRPERNRIDRDHPNFHYRQHAQNQNMEILPSTTGNDPIIEDIGEAETISSDSTDLKSLNRPDNTGPPGMAYSDNSPPRDRQNASLAVNKKGASARPQQKLRRKSTRMMTEEDKILQAEMIRPPSLWNVYCSIITFWCPDALLKCFGKPAKAQQRAWREKMGLISIILLICAGVGFLTFGFTQVVCGTPGLRLKVNQVDSGYMIFHGRAYELSSSHHPPARGIPLDANVLYDLPDKHGGQDGSFLFQNVNGACKGLISASPNSDVPSNPDGSLAWYFPCTTFNQDGSTAPNKTIPFYLGYSCHTTKTGRDAFYGLNSAGEVYFNWNDVRNSSRNLMVYAGDVLDLDLLQWFNGSQVTIPAQFENLRTNPAVRGVDVTHAFQTSADKQIGRCLQEIIRVGSIDTETVGCIASKVVLYVSLVFIISIVLVKFFLALFFGWVFSRRYAPPKTTQSGDSKERKQQIEEWSDDIYRPPPKLSDAVHGVPDRSSKRGSNIFPTTSRFTSPYATERSGNKTRLTPTTMAGQNSTSRLVPPNPLYSQNDSSRGSIDPFSRNSVRESRSSLMLSQANDARFSSVMSEVDGPGPAGFIHEAVVPQPPPEYQPAGYPLAHGICLVTAYSEGEEGIRTTLDSIATTDYPNSHKIILVICDGLIRGQGEDLTTPEICLGMMKDHAVLPHEVQSFSYVAVASGSKRHNMAQVYAGFYDYGERSAIPAEKQQRVPMMVVVKCGTPDESNKSKPGNRGKRDSQIILMSFLQKVMFDERMTELEFEMFNGIWKITGISPDFYEIVLMVDADTKVFPDSMTHMISAMVQDPEIMGLCGETKIANKRQSWVTMIQVFEYFISHHLSKSFESIFGGVTCLPGCFCMYRIKAPKGGQNYWVPILANPDVVEHYSENVVDTLHKKNLLLLGEDRYLSTLMLKTFPKRKQVFVPQAVCKTTVPDKFSVLLSQRRRWINSTVHNLMELVLVRDLCGTFCFSMQFVVFIELLGTLVLPAAIAFTFYLIVISFVRKPAPIIPLVLLALILGLPAVLIVLTAHRWSYVLWMLIYLLSLPIWNLVLPSYAYWKFDDFSWGDTRKTAGEKTKKAGIEYEGEFDSSKITMKRWGDFEKERRQRVPSTTGWSKEAGSSLLTVRTGPGAAILPPGITRLTLSFNKKCYDGHSGPRHFWRSYLPRLKFHNPGVPMDVVRGEGAPGPATLTLALAGGVERVLDVRYKSAEEIWAQVRGAVRVQEVQEGVEDALLRAEVAREVAKREEVRSAVRAVVEGQRREKELLKVAREGGGVV